MKSQIPIPAIQKLRTTYSGAESSTTVQLPKVDRIPCLFLGGARAAVLMATSATTLSITSITGQTVSYTANGDYNFTIMGCVDWYTTGTLLYTT